MSNPYKEVVATVTDYFDGLHQCDVALLERVFEPHAILACATEGSLAFMTLDQYLPIVAGRESPASRSEMRRDEIVSIEFAGPVTCVVRVRCAIGPKHFTDLLTMVCLDDRWQIISKVYHFDLLTRA